MTQTLSAGVERIKPLLFPLLKKVLERDGQAVRGVYERNDAAIRELEGLPQGKGWFGGDGGPTRTEITENGIVYGEDFENGQKTGFFLDQKYNRRAVAQLARGRRVLDCFTHTGSFALHAAAGGAAHVCACLLYTSRCVSETDYEEYKHENEELRKYLDVEFREDHPAFEVCLL